jgi:transcriptional regulator with XRE-family HTH domain
MENLGMKIRKQREKLGLKVYELANKIGVNPVYITQIEKHNKLPSPTVFKKIEKALKLGPDFQKLYVQKKYPEFGDVLKGVLQEESAKHYMTSWKEDLSNLPPEVREINSRFIALMTSGKEADTHPIAVKLVKQHYPSRIDDEVLINQIANGLKKLKKKSKDFWKDFRIDLADIIKAAA